MTMSATKILSEYRSLKATRSIWDTRWQRVKEWLEPQKAYITEETEPMPTMEHRSRIHDSKGIEAVGVLTSAHMSYITPLNEDWLGFTMSRSVKVKMEDSGGLDEAEGYFNKCSAAAMEAIVASNFYTSSHSLYKDRATIGTGAMMLKKGKNGGLNFVYIPAGTYCFSEGEDGLPNAFFREYELTLGQAMEEFGEESFGAKLMALVAQSSSKPEILHQKHKFLNVVKERGKRDHKKEDKANMPYSDCNICLTDSKILNEGGYQEFPYLVSRYERWGNYCWGYSPSYNALPNVLSANYIRKIMKTLGEVAAFPRILQLAGEKRQIDLRAGGRTIVSREAAQSGFPREWGSSGRYDVGMALLEQDHEAIDQFFHVPLFRMFASIDKPMTATEVGAREREKLLMFAPSFTQFVTDMTPMILRIFSMLEREGKLPEPPSSLIEQDQDGTAFIPQPEVVFQSKVALAIKGLEGEGFDRVLARLANVVQFAPDILDNFDFDQIFRDLSRNEGMPENWLKMKKAVDELREARAEAQAKAEEVAQAEQVAGAIGKAGGAEGIEQLAGAAEEGGEAA